MIKRNVSANVAASLIKQSSRLITWLLVPILPIDSIPQLPGLLALLLPPINL